MKEINFLETLHSNTHRNYLERANLPDRPECMRVASKYGVDYWDGDRKHGYGGYKDDGRWKPVAEAFIAHYCLGFIDTILDIGCGKGYLLTELQRLLDKSMSINNFAGYYGCDISQYAINEAERGFAGFSRQNIIYKLPYKNDIADFLYSINVLHNLGYADLKLAIREIVRVMKDKAWICVESFRTEEEKCNLLNWALTAQSYYSPDDWKNILGDNGYTGDVGFVYFT